MGNVITVNLDWITVKISSPIERQMSRKTSGNPVEAQKYLDSLPLFLPVSASTAILNPISSNEIEVQTFSLNSWGLMKELHKLFRDLL